MALAVGDRVIEATWTSAGLRPDPPLVGTVDVVGGTPPNVVKINWEDNGVQEFFDAATSAARLIKISADSSADQFVGRWVNTTGGGAKIIDSFFVDEARTFLARTQEGFYIVGIFSHTYPSRATSLSNPGEPV